MRLGGPWFGRDARSCVKRGIAIAANLGHAAVGSEHILLGVAKDERGAEVLASLGVDTEHLRRTVLEGIAERGDDPEGPDPRALSTLGIDLGEVRDRARVFNPGPRWSRRRKVSITHEARAAVRAAVPVAEDRRDRIITPVHLLAGLAVGRASRARDVLGHLDVTSTDVLALVP